LKEFTDAVINHRKSVVIVSLLFMVLGGLLFFLVPINYNLTDYLPERANSTIALNKMQQEYLIFLRYGESCRKR